jgi:uncharacterized protein YukE
MRPDAMGMRQAASQFQSKADRAAALAARLEGHVGSMAYTGPAADQFRRAIAEINTCLKGNARVIRELADNLNTAAAQAEADPVRFYGRGVE